MGRSYLEVADAVISYGSPLLPNSRLPVSDAARRFGRFRMVAARLRSLEGGMLRFRKASDSGTPAALAIESASVKHVG